MLKKISRNKWLLVLALVGFFMIMFDQSFSLGRLNPYPAYDTDPNYSLEFQVYSLNYTYGAWCDVDGEGFYTGNIFYQLTLDVVPDVLGFILLAVVLNKMNKFSRIFGIASLMSWMAVLLYCFIHLMPFFFNGMTLSYMSFWMSIAMYGIEAIVGYVFVCGICDTLSSYEFRQSRRAITISWFGAIVVSAVVCILRWIAAISPALLVVYEIIQLGIYLLLFYFIMRDSDFIVKDKTLEA